MSNKNKESPINELYWDLLEALQDGVQREIKNYLEAFSPCKREKKSLPQISKIVDEIYSEYTERGRKADEMARDEK